jgi:vitamin B12 transporter
LGGWDLAATLDWQDPRDDTTGKMLARRSQRHGSIKADYTAGALSAGAAVLFASRRFDDTANRNELPGYGLLHLHASYRLAPNWSALVRWNNATDKQYELARYYQTAGSTVFAGIRYGID